MDIVCYVDSCFGHFLSEVGAAISLSMGYKGMIQLRIFSEAYTPKDFPSVHLVADATLIAPGAFLLRSACCVLKKGAEGLGAKFCTFRVYLKGLGVIGFYCGSFSTYFGSCG